MTGTILSTPFCSGGTEVHWGYNPFGEVDGAGIGRGRGRENRGGFEISEHAGARAKDGVWKLRL